MDGNISHVSNVGRGDSTRRRIVTKECNFGRITARPVAAPYIGARLNHFNP